MLKPPINLRNRPTFQVNRSPWIVGDLGPKLAMILAGVISYLVSMYLAGLHTGGDQEKYHSFWDAVSTATPADLFGLQLLETGSAEPGYRYLIYVATRIIPDKDLFMSLLNAFFVVGLLRICRKYKCGSIFTIFLIANFYCVAMMFTLERLKISYLLCIYGFLLMPRKIGWALFISAPLFHFQSALMLPIPLAIATARWFGALRLRSMPRFRCRDF